LNRAPVAAPISGTSLTGLGSRDWLVIVFPF
jgi:hypothetical protein